MKMCRWACGHTLRVRDHVRNDDIRERTCGEHHREVQESKIEVVWTCEEARPRQKTTSEERLWRWYHRVEEEEEDRSRDGWTVS